MPKNEEFNSKKELDSLCKLLTNDTPVIPSEVLKFYDKLENFIIKVHQKGFDSGYEKGVDMKKRIDKNLNN